MTDRDRPFSDSLSTAKSERSPKPADPPESAAKPSETDEAELADAAVRVEDDSTDEDVADVADDDDETATVAAWVAAFEELSPPKEKQPAKTESDNPFSTVAVAGSATQPDGSALKSNAVADSNELIVDEIVAEDTATYSEKVPLPADHVVAAPDANAVQPLTASTVISPQEFAAAQEAIQRAAEATVRPPEPPADLQAAATQAQASSAALSSAVLASQAVPEAANPSDILDQRGVKKDQSTPATRVTSAATINPATASVTEVAPAERRSDTDTAKPAGPIEPSGAEFRAAKIETERTDRTERPATGESQATLKFDAGSFSDTPPADTSAASTKPTAAKPEVAPPVTREQFTQQNEPTIVRSVGGLLRDNGGEMRIRLDPPSLGNIAVRVKVTGSGAEVSFVTPNGDAAKVLGQSLHQLKHSLEAAGIQVDRLNVRHAQQSESQSDSQQDGRQEGDGTQPRDGRQQDQSRAREELARRWRNVIYGDDLDAAA